MRQISLDQGFLVVVGLAISVVGVRCLMQMGQIELGDPQVIKLSGVVAGMWQYFSAWYVFAWGVHFVGVHVVFAL